MTDKTPFRPVSNKVDFVEIEHRMLEFWNRCNILESYLHKNDSAEQVHSFIDGPITANNPMGVHHSWGRTYKDVFQRFYTMLGYAQRYQNGFDGQGLWVEVEVEKELGFKSKKDIEQYGIDKFVNRCKERVDKFADIITEQSKRLGYFMDWENSYHTKDSKNNYLIWHFLKHCHGKGWLYEGQDVMPWCSRCGTGLSQHEIVTEGYREVVHPGLSVLLPIVGAEENLLIWTTTPWTLPVNVMVAVNEDLEYAKVRNYWKVANGQKEVVLWVAKSRLNTLKGKYEIIETKLGRDLIGKKYLGPFDEFEINKAASKAHQVIHWEGVSDNEGTGLVHMAPGAGPDDYKINKQHKLPVIAPLDENGCFKAGFAWLSHKHAKEVNEEIFDSLRTKGLLYKLEKYKHRYPFCWRCGSELVYRLVSEWFISMDELRPRLIEETKKMEWVPAFGLDREIDWLQNMSDWMISKKRYWGLVLPIFKCQSCANVEVIGSREELKERAISGWEQFEGNSPHRPWIDKIAISCNNCNQTVKRIKDVGNPWLDAGIVSFSTLEFGSDDNYFQRWYPADWISESFPGQFRNWFYSLIAMSVALEGKYPAKSVFTYALMRDEYGDEMHKSKGNSILFDEAADKMGADAMRWLFLHHPPENNLHFGFRTVDEVRRRFIIPFWNIYSFFVTYANLDKWSFTGSDKRLNDLKNELDRWIISELQFVISDVTECMRKWQIRLATDHIEKFVSNLSDWYVRRSRRRFWKSEMDSDKDLAYTTLYICLRELSKLLAPFIPFITEEIYSNLVVEHTKSSAKSVHLCSYPSSKADLKSSQLSKKMGLAIRLSKMARSARASQKLKIRQPVAAVVVKLKNENETVYVKEIADILCEEVNAKELKIYSDKADDPDQLVLSSVSVKPNFSVLGPKIGSNVKNVAKYLQNLNDQQLMELATKLSNSTNSVTIDGIEMSTGDLVIKWNESKGYSVSSDDGYVVAVKTELSDELIAEGWARDIVHTIQNLRKEAKLNIDDRIKLNLTADKSLLSKLEPYFSYITSETLTTNLWHQNSNCPLISTKILINNYDLNIALSKS